MDSCIVYLAHGFTRGGLGGVYNSARRSQRTREERDIGTRVFLKVKVLTVLLSFCSFLLLYFACLGSVLEKVSGDMKALANLKYNSNSDKCSL